MTVQTEPRKKGGFAWGAGLGVGLVALIGLGWILGSGGAESPDPTVEGGVVTAESSVPKAWSPAVSEPSPHAGAELSVETDPVLERLRADLDAAPTRLDLRKRLALELLRRAQFFAAFEEAERILAESPGDIDGLFVVGAVRVRMGQPSRALPLLDQVLEQVPDHVPALTAKGQALLKAGHVQNAVAVWNRALELSGGSNAQVEEFLREVPEKAASPHPPTAR